MTDSEESDYPPSAIVIDVGSCWTRGGEAGNDRPTAVIPSFTATTDDQKSKSISSIKYPIKHGIITNKDDVELLWHNLFENELKIDPSERNILLTDRPLNPKSNKETMIELMFESFDVSGCQIGTA